MHAPVVDMGQGTEVAVQGNTMTVVREWTSEDGVAHVMRNAIVVVKPGEWQQHVTVNGGGKLVSEWRLTHRRTQ